MAAAGGGNREQHRCGLSSLQQVVQLFIFGPGSLEHDQETVIARNRHCERSEAIQSVGTTALDCVVALLLAMTSKDRTKCASCFFKVCFAGRSPSRRHRRT